MSSLIDFIVQILVSMLVFPLVNQRPSNLIGSPTPPPPTSLCEKQGIEGLRQINTCRKVPLLVNFLRIADSQALVSLQIFGPWQAPSVIGGRLCQHRIQNTRQPKGTFCTRGLDKVGVPSPQSGKLGWWEGLIQLILSLLVVCTDDVFILLSQFRFEHAKGCYGNHIECKLYKKSKTVFPSYSHMHIFFIPL